MITKHEIDQFAEVAKKFPICICGKDMEQRPAFHDTNPGLSGAVFSVVCDSCGRGWVICLDKGIVE